MRRHPRCRPVGSYWQAMPGTICPRIPNRLQFHHVGKPRKYKPTARKTSQLGAVQLRTQCGHGGFRSIPDTTKSLIYWQEWQGSNLRPPVLETGALPIELHSCREPASPPIPAVSSTWRARNARAKRERPAVRLLPCCAATSRDNSARKGRSASRPDFAPKRCRSRPVPPFRRSPARSERLRRDWDRR